MRWESELVTGLTWDEVVHSDDHPGLITRNRIVAMMDVNKSTIIDTAQRLYLPIRLKLGRLKVSSFFRCSELNVAAGGSKTSQHMIGAAFDIKPLDVDLRAAWEWIAYESGLEFGQCLLEGYGKGTEPRWIHVSSRFHRHESRWDEVGYGPSNGIRFVSVNEVERKRMERKP